jgi:hypothetical protein
MRVGVRRCSLGRGGGVWCVATIIARHVTPYKGHDDPISADFVFY